MSNPFDYVNDINHKKKNIMRGTDNDELAEGYKREILDQEKVYD